MTMVHSERITDLKGKKSHKNPIVLFMKMRDKINQELVYTIIRKGFWDFLWHSV